MVSMNEQVTGTSEKDDSKRRAADVIFRTVNLYAGIGSIATRLGSFYYIDQYNKKVELINDIDGMVVQSEDDAVNAEAHQQYRQSLAVDANNLYNNYRETSQMSSALLAIFSLALFCSTFRRSRTKTKKTELQ